MSHELGHALSAEKGMMDFRIFSQNHYDIILRNVTYDEYNAVEFENEIRLEYNIPLRIGYTFDSKGNIFMEFIDK